MFLNAKTLAFTGVLLALTELCIIGSGIFEWNTLILLAAAAFLVGIVIREWGMKAGAAFYAAAVLLGVILAPNKLYCVTFAAMGIYILASEGLFRILAARPLLAHRKAWLWIGKWAVFNLMFLPMALLFPQLLFLSQPEGIWFAAILLGGQVIWFLFDVAYGCFQETIWGKIRRHMFRF